MSLRTLTLFALLLLGYLVYVYFVKTPSHDRDWEVGFEQESLITRDQNFVTFDNLRDFEYGPGELRSKNRTSRTIDIDDLERVWFVVEPFDGVPVIDFDGIAHTYFVFDFADQEPIGVTVEARREEGEKFNILSGMLNEYELLYVWATEKDLTGGRVLNLDHDVYMYPLTITSEQGRSLFLQVIETTQKLENQPRFYNTLTSNCTNELAKNANLIKPGLIPRNVVWFFPGYAIDQLYELGLIPTDQSLEELEDKYYISDVVKQYSQSDSFSGELRNYLGAE